MFNYNLGFMSIARLNCCYESNHTATLLKVGPMRQQTCAVSS